MASRAALPQVDAQQQRQHRQKNAVIVRQGMSEKSSRTVVRNSSAGTKI